MIQYILILSLMNLFRLRDTVKNSMTQEYDIPENLDLLNKWTIPKIDPKMVYKLGTFEKIGFKQVVKTTESSIPLHEEEIVIKLLSQSDILPYKRTHKFIHIGCVQVAFRPLTLNGLPESFLASLRDGRNLNWKQSLMGIIESSLALGPVYFDAYPNLSLSLSDSNIFEALTLNVKTHGYNYIPGTEVMCICYRIYYKPLFTLNPMCKKIEKDNNETILIETNFGKSNITTRRSIKWEEIIFPENWLIEQSVPKNPILNSDFEHITQIHDGIISIGFQNSQKRKSTSYSRSISSHSFISPLDYEVKLPSEARASTSSYEENFYKNNNNEKIIINENNIIHKDEFDPETISDCNFKI